MVTGLSRRAASAVQYQGSVRHGALSLSCRTSFSSLESQSRRVTPNCLHAYMDRRISSSCADARSVFVIARPFPTTQSSTPLHISSVHEDRGTSLYWTPTFRVQPPSKPGKGSVSSTGKHVSASQPRQLQHKKVPIRRFTHNLPSTVHVDLVVRR